MFNLGGEAPKAHWILREQKSKTEFLTILCDLVSLFYLFVHFDFIIQTYFYTCISIVKMDIFINWWWNVHWIDILCRNQIQLELKGIVPLSPPSLPFLFSLLSSSQSFPPLHISSLFTYFLPSYPLSSLYSFSFHSISSISLESPPSSLYSVPITSHSLAKDFSDNIFLY